MKRITISILAVICLASVIHGMECPLSPDQDIFKQARKSCPRLGLDPHDNSFCCININTRTAHCCDSSEWITTTAGLNLVELAASSGYKTKLHQTSNILFYICILYILVSHS